MEEQSMQSKTWKIFFILLVFLIATLSIFYVINSTTVKSLTVIPSPSATKTTSTPVREENSIDMGEEALSPGKSITINNVKMLTQGYVVVYKYIEGKGGVFLGKSSVLPIGKNKNVTVDLSEKIVDGDKIALVLFGTDELPIEDEEGNQIQVEKTVGTGD